MTATRGAARDAGLGPGSPPSLPDLLSVAAAGVLVYSLALVAHEAAHAGAGALFGGTPELISSTDTRGDWSRLDAPGILAVGVSGSLANLVLAAFGWWLMRRGRGAPTTWTAVGWLFFAVNAWIPTSYLIVSPLLGFGDWATVASAFPNQGPLRASLTVSGLFLAALLWKETPPALGRAVGGGATAQRRARASRLVRVAWISGGAVALAAALLSPLSLAWAVLVAAGSTLGATVPMLPAARAVGEHPVPGAPLRMPRSGWLLAAGTGAGLLLIGVFGPGVRLGG